MTVKTNENLVLTDDTEKSIPDTDITDITAILDTTTSVLTISWTSKTNDNTISQNNESSGAIQDPPPPKGVAQFEITEGSSRSSSKNYSQTFDNMANVGDYIFVWTQTDDSRNPTTDRGTEIAVQES